MPILVVDSIEAVRRLAASILDPARDVPLLCVTTRHKQPDPLLDAETLALAVAPLPVHLLRTGPLTWEMNAILPQRFEVYGGAARLWWPGLSPADDFRWHPLFICEGEYDGPAVIRRVAQALAGRGHAVRLDIISALTGTVAADPAPTVPPVEAEVGDEIAATVLEVHPGGVLVRLTSGRQALIKAKPGKPNPPVLTGQAVTVVVTGANAATGDVVIRWAPTPTRADPAAPEPAESRPAPTPLDVAPAAHSGPDVVQILAVAETDAALAAAQAEVERLRRAAGRIVEELNARIDAAQHRIAAVVNEQLGDLIDTLRVDLDDARGRARTLETELDDAVAEKRDMAVELRRRNEAISRLRKDLKGEKDARAHVEQRLHGRGVFDDPEAQFRHEIDVAWKDLRAPGDGAVGDLRGYVLGASFLASLEVLDGMPRDQIVRKIAAMLGGAMREWIHPMRTSEAGDAAQRIRTSDGARAFRFYLQHKSPAARRLNYWEMPGGVVELANVAVHDAVDIR